MNEQLKKLLRLNLLCQLEEAGINGMKADSLRIGAAGRGWEASQAQVDTELAALCDAKLIHLKLDPINPKLSRFHLTCEGRAALQREHLV